MPAGGPGQGMTEQLMGDTARGARHVLITGGAGFIGSHTVERLIAAGDRVTVLDDLSTGSLDNLAAVAEHPDFRFIRGDATRPLGPQLGELAPTHIVHLAAQVSVIASMADPLRDLEQNLVGTLRVIELARDRGVSKVVFASSAATYGDAPQPSSEGLVPQPLSPYGIHKLASEHHLRVAALAHGVSTLSLRFFNVYGPRQVPTSSYAGVISIFLARAARGEPLVLFGGGVATRDFVYVKDLARAIALGLEGGPSQGEALNVGTGAAVSVRELAHAILEVTGSSSALVDAPARAGEALHSRAEVAHIAAALDWRANTSLAEGLAETSRWISKAPTPRP